MGCMMTKSELEVLLEYAMRQQRAAAQDYHISDLAALEYERLTKEISHLTSELRNAMRED